LIEEPQALLDEQTGKGWRLLKLLLDVANIAIMILGSSEHRRMLLAKENWWLWKAFSTKSDFGPLSYVYI